MAPKIHHTAYIDKHSVVYGNVEVGSLSSIWPGAVLRADSKRIRVGRGSNIQDNCTVHADDRHDVSISDGVTIGHNAIVHGAHIGKDSLIGMGAIVLDGVVLGSNCIVAPGAVIAPGTRIAKGSVVMGIPARIVRKIRQSEIVLLKRNAKHYVRLRNHYASDRSGTPLSTAGA